MKRMLGSFAFVLLALAGCGTQKMAARELAARDLGCPEDSVRITKDKDDKRLYSATGCGNTVRVACHDPYDSTGASKGWGDHVTARNRVDCETIIDRPAAKTTTTNARVFDRDLAAKLVTAAADRAKTCGAPSGGPRGEGHLRMTFANEGTVQSVEIDAPFADTEAGRCVEREMTRVVLPRFDGEPVAVKKTFVVD